MKPRLTPFMCSKPPNPNSYYADGGGNVPIQDLASIRRAIKNATTFDRGDGWDSRHKTTSINDRERTVGPRFGTHGITCRNDDLAAYLVAVQPCVVSSILDSVEEYERRALHAEALLAELTRSPEEDAPSYHERKLDERDAEMLETLQTALRDSGTKEEYIPATVPECVARLAEVTKSAIAARDWQHKEAERLREIESAWETLKRAGGARP